MSPVNPPSVTGSGDPGRVVHERHSLLFHPTPSPATVRAITEWEEITCVGYNPALRRLEAIVRLKQAAGYDGELFPAGTAEFVRFYVDFMDGRGFTDLGVTSFRAADRFDPPPGPVAPLSFMVFLHLDDATDGRFIVRRAAIAPTLRAILSWQHPPPPAAPDFLPAFGNIRDAHITLQERPAARMLEVFDLAAPSRARDAHPSTVARADSERTAPSAPGTAVQAQLDFPPPVALANLRKLPVLRVDPPPMLSPWPADDRADDGFEEIVDVGLHPETDTLGAVVHIKRPSGYHGDLCQTGSTEHVAFWADWDDDGVFERHLGTTSFEIPGAASLPVGGLFYNVALPLDVAWRLRSGPVPNYLRVRAVLSWEALPSTTEPGGSNLWGNSVDALVALRSGRSAGLGARVSLVGNVDRRLIDPARHLYNCCPGVSSPAHARPWGGSISFHGGIDRNGFDGTIRFRFCYKPSDAPDHEYQPVSRAESFKLWQPAVSPLPYTDIQSADDAGWYVYAPNPALGTFGYAHNYLAHLQASALPDGTYTIRFEHTDELDRPVVGEVFSIVICNQGMAVSPTANTAVDRAKELDLMLEARDDVADAVLTGRLRVVHPFFGWWTLKIRSAAQAHGAVPQPEARAHEFPGDHGDGDAPWSLDTTPLEACGYMISLDGYSRVILNSNPGAYPHYGPKAIGYAKPSGGTSP